MEVGLLVLSPGLRDLTTASTGTSLDNKDTMVRIDWAY